MRKSTRQIGAIGQDMGRKERPTKRSNGEKRFEDVVLVAGKLFAEQGFNGTSLKDIADEVGVLKGSLYHYIDSKEDLLYEVIKTGNQGLGENMRICDHFASSPAEQLVAFCYGHILLNAVHDRIDRGIVFIQDAKYLATDKRQQIFADRDVYQGYLRSIISRGIAANIFDQDIDQRMCSFATLGVLTSYIRWYKPEGTVTPHSLARESAAFVAASMLVTSAKSSRFSMVDRVIDQFRQISPAR